jgi:hypothetical protein
MPDHWALVINISGRSLRLYRVMIETSNGVWDFYAMSEEDAHSYREGVVPVVIQRITEVVRSLLRAL